MNRRRFLSTLGVVAATTIIDPERLLWIPDKKTIFVPKNIALYKQWLEFEKNRIGWFTMFPPDSAFWVSDAGVSIFNQIQLGNSRAMQLGFK